MELFHIKTAKQVEISRDLFYRFLGSLDIGRFPYAPLFSGTVRQSGYVSFMVKFPSNTTLPVQVGQYIYAQYIPI